MKLTSPTLNPRSSFFPTSPCIIRSSRIPHPTKFHLLTQTFLRRSLSLDALDRGTFGTDPTNLGQQHCRFPFPFSHVPGPQQLFRYPRSSPAYPRPLFLSWPSLPFSHLNTRMAFNIPKQNIMFAASPRSSTSSNRSYDATPESKLTAFSPEDRVPNPKSTAAKVASTPLKAGHHDPFVTGKPKLSATALAFEPFGIPSGQHAASSSAGRGRSLSMSPAPTDYSQKQKQAPAESDQYGTFTTSTGASRCMKVRSIYGANVEELVQDSLGVSFPSPPLPRVQLVHF